MSKRVIKVRSHKRYPTFHIGDTVVVDDPAPEDIYEHSFVGTITAVGGTLVMVKDQDGNVFDIEKEKVHKLGVSNGRG